jgi:thiol:disulfide interchange protein
MQIRSNSLSILFLAFFFTAVISNSANAQASPATVATYTAENPGWITNLDEAYAISKKTGKPIMANFTGSDWCGWCKRLTAAVFSQPDFKTWADKNVVLLELDYPRGKFIPENIRVQNSNLQQAFQVSGYPTVWVFDLDKDAAKNNYNVVALGKTGYRASVAEFTGDVTPMLAARKK